MTRLSCKVRAPTEGDDEQSPDARALRGPGGTAKSTRLKAKSTAGALAGASLPEGAAQAGQHTLGAPATARYPKNDRDVARAMAGSVILADTYKGHFCGERQSSAGLPQRHWMAPMS